MNRLVLALVVVALAGAVVAGVRRTADAQDGQGEDLPIETQVRYLGNRVSRLEAAALPFPDPNVYRWDQADPLTRVTSVSSSQFGFLMTCTITEAMSGYFDLWCVRPGGLAVAVPSTSASNASAVDGGRVPSAGGDRDCYHFATQREAQTFFEAEGGPTWDEHRLDDDFDGVACETLP